uniref:Major facilitator superfamily protein n=1 Tax=Ochrobactrum sp. LM19 TaxID=1449781 RepID=A0A0D5A0P5_9HYPH|nr:hypothetical protein [Ochrobactrum sp. LM19]AJW29875.1 major facilitator superfamily protein [Ochrobactrum sp. LM19]
MTAIVFNSFVTVGVEAVGIEFLRMMGMDLAEAVAIVALLVVFKVGGRVIDLLVGRRWDGLYIGIVSDAMIHMGAGCDLDLSRWNCTCGRFPDVTKGTMSLVFFEKADYTAAVATIALPMNLINALAPPVLRSSSKDRR